MKALAAEMTANFAARLSPLGIIVKELTGGIQSTLLPVGIYNNPLRCGVVGNTLLFHSETPGSIPGIGNHFFHFDFFLILYLYLSIEDNIMNHTPH
jgi:hypothetical protein